MIRKSQLFLAVAALVGMNAAMAACNTTQWGQGGVTAVVGTPIADGPVASDANAAQTPRYSGKCGLASAAAGSYVQDGSPLTEAAYISRFYVKPNNTGEAVVFQAMADETADYAIFQITFDAAANAFKFYGSNGAGGFGTPVSITTANGGAIVANRWYMIETNFQRGAGTNGGTLAVSLIGNRGNANYTLTTPSTTTLTAGNIVLADAGDGVDYVRFGWVSGGAGTGVTVDAFESRRSTAIGSLRRGDASNNGTCTSGDVTQLLQEVNAIAGNSEPGLKLGQTDCSENGSVTSGDATCLLNLVNADTASGGTRACGMPL
ncbi:MAG: hypothetical protein IPG63_10730 [Xanthomonadales bacterium]|nr:hypothetical protein [Xanthomonadales bacterium]